MHLPKLKLSTIVHRGERGFKLDFAYQKNLQEKIKGLQGARWSQTHKAWWIPEREHLFDDLYHQLKRDFYVVCQEEEKEAPLPEVMIKSIKLPTQLSPERKAKVNELRRWMLSRRYSESTIGTYVEGIEVFLKHFPDVEIENMGAEHLTAFNNDYILAKQLSASYQNQVINAVKLFFTMVESREMKPELIWRPKREKKLPNVLSKEEVKLILNALRNLKHKVMLSLIYSCGLRCGELLKLQPGNIDSKRGLIIIRQAKGKKDRIVPLSPKILVMLREYHQAYSPKEWLFEGQVKGEPYDQRSLQNVLKQAVGKAGIQKPVTLHWLRHSYATHLLESGTDLRYIQELLGHSRSTTTEIYTHVSNKELQRIVSPFDSL